MVQDEFEELRQTEAELISRARQKDNAAVRLIIQLHNRRLYRIARCVVRDDGEAEDVLQEAYGRAFAKLAQFRGDSSLATWLSRIVLNVARGRMRRRHATVELAAVDDRQRSRGQAVPAAPATSPIDPERGLAQREILSKIERAIDNLPSHLRTVLIARAVEGMSVKETAELLGIRPETVSTRLHRARRLLREAIGQDIGPLRTDIFPFGGLRCRRMVDSASRQFERSA